MTKCRGKQEPMLAGHGQLCDVTVGFMTWLRQCRKALYI